MKINNTKLEENYKEIHRICLENGELFPLAIDRPVDESTHLPIEEIKQIRADIPIKELRKMDNKRAETYKQRRIQILRISHNTNDEYSTVDELKVKELQQFIGKYPQFKDIFDDIKNTKEIVVID